MTINIFVFLLIRLKLECEKLAQEKTEMQRHYVMVSDGMRYGNKWHFIFIVKISEQNKFFNIMKFLYFANLKARNAFSFSFYQTTYAMFLLCISF